MKANVNDIKWEELGFSYIQTDLRFISKWQDGAWDEGQLTADATVQMNESANALHYGQTCFEGMKAYRRKDGQIQLFRPDQNAKRMAKSCQRLLMPSFPEEAFVAAVKAVVKANEHWVPPHESGSTLYIRPYMFATAGSIGVAPASEYTFSIFVMPVGPYFKGGLAPTNFIVSDYDRAASHGTGAVKVGGNYASSFLPGKEAKERNFSDCIYLDPKTHTKIEEVGAANFFAITKDNRFVTPTSPSILPSITKYSLLHLAEHYLHLPVSEEDIEISQLANYQEAGACGTAAVISPIGGIQTSEDNFHVFYSETEVGPITRQLYNLLTGIQFGTETGHEGWIVEV
ncbi:branched-chain amino acid aminotransferase [Vagococcus salmoninarum]|uniref:branched-chain amino acid aminotransferase n=1 Tax=Vagococcus salmoninarum TaxID=2739 RepID=UPI001881ACC6|nr:branched-chain amino acid aminotransferase [Vagococcus salmoninarum]MBE9388483.1 branched-chain amino acid aminotransferase [Vagococcus salmoninarum]